MSSLRSPVKRDPGGNVRPVKILLLAVLLLVLAGCAAEPMPVAQKTSQPPAAATMQPIDSPAPTATAPPTVTATATATSPPTETATPTATPTATATATLTPTPTPLPGSELIAFETYRHGKGEVYLFDGGTGEMINLTRHPEADGAPSWRPDGGAIAFQSRRDGNWEIYLLELADGSLTRLTDNLAYDGAPAWNPEGTQIAFESYRDGNLEIYVRDVASGQTRRLTDNAAGDYGPAWRPAGADGPSAIAFTSWRDGNKEIYVVPAEGGEARNLTQHPADDEDPAWTTDGSALAFVSWRDVDGESGNRNAEIYRIPWSEEPVAAKPEEAERITQNPWPDLDPAWDLEGRLVWSAYDPGPPFETYDPYRPGDHHLYRLGASGPEALTADGWDERRPAAAPYQISALDLVAQHLPPVPPTSTPWPTLAPGTHTEIVEVPSMEASFAQQPIRVNERVAPSLVAWQRDVLEASGRDYLASTLGAWRPIGQSRTKEMYAYDYGYLSWHKAGRALDLALDYRVENTNQMILVREDIGQNVYWRMYLRTARQDGSQGEPLKENPWRHWWHIVAEHEPEAYAAGGKRLPIPDGYYVDVTAIAKRHGWERIACYAIEDDYHWRTDSNATEYWHYERTDNLIWWDAMSQLYQPEVMQENLSWDIGLERAQSEDMMRSKGVPSP